jgi:hypothetical protein
MLRDHRADIPVHILEQSISDLERLRISLDVGGILVDDGPLTPKDPETLYRRRKWSSQNY